MSPSTTWKPTAVLILFCVSTALASSAQTFTQIASLVGTQGNGPVGGLVQGTDGNLYGATGNGGAPKSCGTSIGCGTLFRVTTAGDLSILYTFKPFLGAHPDAPPTLGADGNFYGTTTSGGSDLHGAIYEITPHGVFTTEYNFFGPDAQYPNGLLLAANGNFYGTTAFGGPYISGTFFEMTPEGEVTTLYDFCQQANCPDGQVPKDGLIQGSDGNFYGVTPVNDNTGWGTVFKITPEGVLTTLHTFCSLANCADGATPNVKLAQGTDGAFYGTTVQGGEDNYGTVFRVTSSGTFTRIYSFCMGENCSDGANPHVGLILGTDGNLYGTTSSGGGGPSWGNIFKITQTGALTSLYDFDGDNDQDPSQLLQATDGNFYGTTQLGGNGDQGTVFKLSNGLAPFVKTAQPGGTAGSSVIILGSDLTGATSVSFNGTSAKFTVVSATEITTTVPAGATTGTIQVGTPGGTLSSNAAFNVVP